MQSLSPWPSHTQCVDSPVVCTPSLLLCCKTNVQGHNYYNWNISRKLWIQSTTLSYLTNSTSAIGGSQSLKIFSETKWSSVLTPFSLSTSQSIAMSVDFLFFRPWIQSIDKLLYFFINVHFFNAIDKQINKCISQGIYFSVHTINTQNRSLFTFPVVMTSDFSLLSSSNISMYWQSR